jgi:hypothetical protein
MKVLNVKDVKITRNLSYLAAAYTTKDYVGW